MFRPCALVPVFDHERTAAGVLAALRAMGLKVIIVDDGSSVACAEALSALAAADPDDLTLSRLPENQGKGGAVMHGLRLAAQAGYSHALQVDADGQHALEDAAALLAAAQARPEAVVCGAPVFDPSSPLGRRLGRKLTNLWVWINTLSFDIPDAQCGFRVYPLAPCLKVLGSAELGKRMAFDIEILVRLHWQGSPVHCLPTRVRYPEGGRSHFRLLGDNWGISATHARLFFGMLRRSPGLLRRRWARA